VQVVDELRRGCALVAGRARQVTVQEDAIAVYARSLQPAVRERLAAPPDPEAHAVEGDREHRAAFWLTLDAINFGSGWFPTLRKRGGRSGYFTIAIGLRERFAAAGAWPARELQAIQAVELARTLGQDPEHPLMYLFAASLHDLGRRVERDAGGSFAAVTDVAPSAVSLVELMARWDCFADFSRYDGIELPFLKRAQIAAADLARGGVYAPHDLDRLTMFADNLVPHVLRVDGVLRYDPALVDRIDGGELLEHGSPEEVEIRACAVHAVELIAAAMPEATPALIDETLWHRGQQPRYKALARHRSRCTAY
jgi:hypothetical protein